MPFELLTRSVGQTVGGVVELHRSSVDGREVSIVVDVGSGISSEASQVLMGKVNIDIVAVLDEEIKGLVLDMLVLLKLLNTVGVGAEPRLVLAVLDVGHTSAGLSHIPSDLVGQTVTGRVDMVASVGQSVSCCLSGRSQQKKRCELH